MTASHDVTAIILAAGQGKRMKSNLPKVLHKVLGREMIDYTLRALELVGIRKPLVVVGHCGDQVIDFVGDRARAVWQHDQLGTGHAVQVALPEIENFHGDVIITAGDVPLIPPEAFSTLIRKRREGGYSAVVATMVLQDARAYGRIKRDENGNVQGIVEYRDASEEERRIREVNTATYCFEAESLRQSVANLTNHNAQGELYLTDTIASLLQSGRSVGTYIHPDPDEFMGINDPSELAMAENRLSERVKREILSSGVILEEPSTIRIEPTVRIGPRTRVRSGTILEGHTTIGCDCVVGPHVVLRDVEIIEGTTVSPHLIVGRNGNGEKNIGCDTLSGEEALGLAVAPKDDSTPPEPEVSSHAGDVQR